MKSAWLTMPVRIEPVSTSIRPDHVRVLRLDEVGDPRQNLPAGAQVSGPRQRKVKGGARSGGITDVVYHQTHARHCIDAQCFAHAHRRDTLGACRPASIRSACSSPTRGRKTTITRACSNIWRRRELFTITTPASRRQTADRQGKRARRSAPADRALRSGHRAAGGLSSGAGSGAVSDEFRQGGGSSHRRDGEFRLDGAACRRPSRIWPMR